MKQERGGMHIEEPTLQLRERFKMSSPSDNLLLSLKEIKRRQEEKEKVIEKDFSLRLTSGIVSRFSSGMGLTEETFNKNPIIALRDALDHPTKKLFSRTLDIDLFKVTSETATADQREQIKLFLVNIVRGTLVGLILKPKKGLTGEELLILRNFENGKMPSGKSCSVVGIRDGLMEYFSPENKNKEEVKPMFNNYYRERGPKKRKPRLTINK